MRNYLLLIVLAFTYSCATISAEWSAWKISTEAQADQKWHFCNAALDGPELHRKGMCWVAKECRTKNPWFSGEKKECRRLQLVCKWGEIECMDLNGLFDKLIVHKEKLR